MNAQGDPRNRDLSPLLLAFFTYRKLLLRITDLNELDLEEYGDRDSYD